MECERPEGETKRGETREERLEGERSRTREGERTRYVYLGGGNAVDEADLLESFLSGQSHSHFPSRINRLINDLERLTHLICLVLEIEVYVITEPFHLNKYKTGLSTVVVVTCKH